MRNEKLEQALVEAQVTRDEVATACGVGYKTVERWIAQGRIPLQRHQYAVADLTGAPARDIWPEGSRGTDLVEFHPHRAAVGNETWLRLLDDATEHVDVLAWAATFFHQAQPGISDRLADAARRGVKVRLCFGHPSSDEVAVREAEEPLLGPEVLASKIRVSLGYYRDLVDVDGIEVRLHRAVVYASLFRYDDEIVVNPHVYSRPASENPALHLREGTCLTPTSRASTSCGTGLSCGRASRSERGPH